MTIDTDVLATCFRVLYWPSNTSTPGNTILTTDTSLVTLMAAFISATAALAAALLTSVFAEMYKRHRDKVALAAGIAGELSSYEPALPLIRQILQTAIASLDSGNRASVMFRPIEKPRDLFFEKTVEKLGLLGPTLVRDVVYVYGNLNAFRGAFVLISTHFSAMSDGELRARCLKCLEALERAAERGAPLVKALNRVARVKEGAA